MGQCRLHLLLDSRLQFLLVTLVALLKNT
jgi:hypothetical protein